ncbi:SLC13 family permease [Microbacterium sp. 18062]|uniref:SLC13 family permease n=1 Tax=Microbacterium sp. 18062 TaxID=2681410 RepID=UPI00135AA2AC|nr:SLC13 family permease [Microbacterium sp. 18062]
MSASAAVTAPSAAAAPARLVRPALSFVALALAGGAAWTATASWSTDQRVVVCVFAVATVAWAASRLDDTLVALGAALALVIAGVLPSADLFAALGDSTIWLLIGSCMLAAGIGASGLVERVSAALVSRARTVRGLAHLTTVALTLTVFAMPATSGRAALALPLFRTLGAALPTRGLQVGFSLLFPAVILLSAFASILGAGAHLIAAELVRVSTGTEISFLLWLALGAPLAVLTCHIAAEVVLCAFLSREDRAAAVGSVAERIAAAPDHPRGRLRPAEWRAGVTLVAVVALWLTEPLHGLHPAVVALIGAIVSISPGTGTTAPRQALGAVPWSLLLFLAATLAIGTAFVDSGAAASLADAAFAPLAGGHPATALLAIVVASAFAHLVVQSRSARSSVLVPIVLAVAPAVGLDPAAAALASTAAAGFCLTLTSSAKPVAMFADVGGVATFDRRTLGAFSAVLAPYAIAAVVLAALFWWPVLGVPLMS